MRFCPFCAQETSDDAGRCVHCGRRLGARTAQHAVIDRPAKGPPRPTLLGVGPGEQDDDADQAAGGPTTVSGPRGFLADFPETAVPPSAQTPVGLRAEQPTLISGSSGSTALDEETKLPPPAPGLEPPRGQTSRDPPTLPGIKSGRLAAQSGRHARLRGQAPVARLPETQPPQERGPSIPPPGPGDLTSPMARIDAPYPADSGESPKTSQTAIPALPPPPVGPDRLASVDPPATPPTGTPVTPAPAGPPATGPLRAVTSSLSVLPMPPPASLLPIPAAPSSSGALPAIAYLFPVAHGILVRRREQARIRRNLYQVQQSLDGILLRLGRVAFEERAEAAPLKDEMDLLRQAASRRDEARRETERLQGVRTSEQQRRSDMELEQKDAIVALTREAEQLQGELQARADQRRQLVAELGRIEAELRRLLRTAERADARAGKVQALDPQAASQARAVGDSARGQAEALQPRREALLREAQALEEPIATLTQQLGVVRSDLGLKRQELRRMQAETAQLLRAIDEDMRLCQADREAAEREMQQRMMTIGTLVNLYRMSGERYAPLYHKVDEVKAQLTSYEAILARLDTECVSYDRQAVQKGLLVLGAMGLLACLIIAAIYIIWGLRNV
jgi:hypothetical protein